VVRSLFGTLRLASPRWWHCGCQPQARATFSPLAAVLPTRVTPELQYLEAKFAGLVSYGLTAQLLGEVLPLVVPCTLSLCAITFRPWPNAWKTSSRRSGSPLSRAARGTGPSCPDRTCRWSSVWTAAMSTPARRPHDGTAGSR
jgi:hypothetical protein